MNKTTNNEKFDADILQGKADVFRALNTTSNNTTVTNTEETPSQKDIDLPATEKIPVNEVYPPPKPAADKNEKTSISEKTSEIPRFDLAEEIMAEQRKITAIKRKAPGKKAEIQRLKPKVQPDQSITEQPMPSEQDKIIAEIVARDIEKLCRG